MKVIMNIRNKLAYNEIRKRVNYQICIEIRNKVCSLVLRLLMIDDRDHSLR